MGLDPHRRRQTSKWDVVYVASALVVCGRLLGHGTGVQSLSLAVAGQVGLALLAALILPNVAQLFSGTGALLLPERMVRHPALRLPAWAPSPAWSLAAGVAGGLGLMALGGASEFLYFRF